MDLLGTAGYWLLFALIGTVCGLLNTFASAGSAVSLPLLVMLGLPEGVANATNRLPVFVGALAATLSFAREGQVDWRAAARLVPAAVTGSILGALFAEQLTGRETGILITGAVLLALLLLFTKIKEAFTVEPSHPLVVKWSAVLTIFLVSTWIGLIVVDGTTFLLLVLILWCHYGLVQANALKTVLLAVTTLIPILMFSGVGKIAWVEGGILAAGSVVGAQIGVRFTNYPNAKTWVYRLLVVVILLEFAHLAWHYTVPLAAAI